MAAPKQWGYARDAEITDELLVSWADGDLTKIVGKELEERLLQDPSERRDLAAFARALADTRGDEEVRWSGKMPGSRKLHLSKPRQGLVDNCIGLGSTPATFSVESDGDQAGIPSSVVTSEGPLAGLPVGKLVGGMAFLILTAMVALWMIKNL